MTLSPNLVAKHATEPHHAQTQDDMACDVDQGEEALRVAPKVHRFVAESGERGESAENADEHEGPRFRRESASTFRQLREQADHEAAEKIDRERPHREVIALAPCLNQPAQDVAENRAEKATDADPQNVAHADSS